MGQSAHPGRARGRTAALAAGALVAGSVMLSGCGSPVAAATTVLQRAFDVNVVHPDGSVVEGVSGQSLRHGDLVRTAADGRADLVTKSRVVHVGSDASVRVIDGARQELRHGAVVVDAQHGPGLSLQTAALQVTTPSGSAVRAERAVTVRVGALAGPSRVRTDTGRSLNLPPLFQVVVGGDALPDAPSPLRLTDDDGEARTVPELVSDDEALRSLAAGIDATGRSTARLVTTAWNHPLDGVPVGVARSEQVLPIVIASAVRHGDRMQDYDNAVTWREEGGSWGVVAHLVGVRAPAVADALAVLERKQPAGLVGSVAAVLTSLSSNPSGGGGSPPGRRGPTPSLSQSPGQPRSSASPSPSPTDSPGDVSTAVGQVLSVVPSPSPSAMPGGVSPPPALP